MSIIHLKYKRLKQRRRRNIILNIVCVIIAGSGLAWTANYFWRYISYEITNDAFVDQYIAPINVRVGGYIQEVRFREHQFVHQGDTLVVLDNREYLIKQKEAQAALLNARGSRGVLASGIQTSHTRIAEQDANLAEAKAKLEDGSLNVFDTATFTVEGKKLDSYMADVDTDKDYTKDTEVVENGVFYESKFRSAPYFDIAIDGIVRLDVNFDHFLYESTTRRKIEDDTQKK